MHVKAAKVHIPIRKAGFGDLETLHCLDCRLFPPGVCFDMDTFYFHLVDPLSMIFIAAVDGVIAGFTIFRIDSAATGSVVTIDVEPGEQGRGVGSKLMGAVERAALGRGLKAIILQVNRENETAQRFYEKLGYKKTRLLPGYYHGHGDAWEMKRRLRNGEPRA